MESLKELISLRLEQSIEIKEAILGNNELMAIVEKVAYEIINSLKSGCKVLFCGNGGSAADAQHLAAELSGRFYFDREPLFAEALHVNTSSDRSC